MPMMQLPVRGSVAMCFAVASAFILLGRAGAHAQVSRPRTEPAAAPQPPGSARAADPCRAAEADWREGAIAAREPLAGLEDCLALANVACGADVAAVRSVVAEIAAHESRISWLCGRSR